jgi:glycosyltransferase involved in cell wall biosynthesis
MPVYNGQDTLADAIESILCQTHKDLVLIISDNCSTDATQKICKKYATNDTRVRYFRQATNVGAAKNFAFVLEQSESPYFMWHSADDVRSPNFIEVNHRFLKDNSDFIACTSPTRYADRNFDSKRMGDFPLRASTQANFIAFLSTWHANGRFYSLFRTDALKQTSSVGRTFFGSDWALVLECCQHGKSETVPFGYTLLGRKGVSNSNRTFSAFRNHWYERFAPFQELSLIVFRLSRNFELTARLRITLILLRLNLQALVVQSRLALRPGRRY